MTKEEKQRQIEARLCNVEELQKNRRDTVEKMENMKREIKDGKATVDGISRMIEREMNDIHCIRNNLPVQTILTSDDDEKQD
jgi:hypothetical protein